VTEAGSGEEGGGAAEPTAPQDPEVPQAHLVREARLVPEVPGATAPSAPPAPPEGGPGGPGRPGGIKKLAGQTSRAWLYMLALVLIGLFVLPVVWVHPRVGRAEKALIIFLALLHDLACVAIVVAFALWMYGVCQRAMGGP
jgi:hypothetical protein